MIEFIVSIQIEQLSDIFSFFLLFIVGDVLLFDEILWCVDIVEIVIIFWIESTEHE